MFYCENCYLLNEENTCAFCGSRLTRGPKPDDYCFIGNKCSPWAEMLHGILEDDYIPYSELDHARQLEQALMDSSFEQPDPETDE